MGASDIIESMQELLYDDGGANYIMLSEGLATAGDVISLIIDILVVAIVIFIPLVVALEVLFINIPVLQSKVLTDTLENETMQKIIGVLFKDAKTALVRANTVETGRSANAEYLRIKLKTVFLAFVVVGVALGPVNIIIHWLLSIVDKVIGLIG